MAQPYTGDVNGRSPMSPPTHSGLAHNGERSPVKPYHNAQTSPLAPPGKSVAFELLVTNSFRHTARLPMKVKVHSHDTIESIVTTVKNFYGLYNNPGQTHIPAISFEDKEGNTLIVRYENLSEGMTVYVRVSEDPAGITGVYPHRPYDARSNHSFDVGDTYQMPPPQPAKALNYAPETSHYTSRASRNRSVSPARGRLNDSCHIEPVSPLKKARSRSGYKSRNSSTHGNIVDNIHSDGMTGYSSGDGAPGSVSSRTNIGNTDISLDNIVEGGRRKRAKFESSVGRSMICKYRNCAMLITDQELPLFAPAQMPAATSNSSVSPIRRMDQHRASYPFPQSVQHPFTNPQPLQSPQSYNNGFGQPGLYTTPANASRRVHDGEPSSRSSYGSTSNGIVSNVLPTPDPTVRSCYSELASEEDKDVAIQLMRLGDMSNISHGRISATGFDDGYSGRADATSSAGVTSESDSEMPLDIRSKREPSPILPPGTNRTPVNQAYGMIRHQQSPDSIGRDDIGYKSGRQDELLEDIEGLIYPNAPKSVTSLMPKPRNTLPSNSTYKIVKPSAKQGKPRTALPSALPMSGKSKAKTQSISDNPVSPSSTNSHSRKVSAASALNFQHQLGDDEEDLSSKPRCQRCRKSKKGCDRQRPCQRCKDAGLSADQCISEDEGNGRKGRYGRHMGVPVKKEDMSAATGGAMEVTIQNLSHHTDKSKKRKR